MIRGTFCDWLINQGVEFHPDTVIVDATNSSFIYDKLEIEKIGRRSKLSFDNALNRFYSETSQSMSQYSQTCIAPPFDHMFLESNFGESREGCIVRVVYAPPNDVYLVSFMQFLAHRSRWTFSDWVSVILTPNGEFNAHAGFSMQNKFDSWPLYGDSEYSLHWARPDIKIIDEKDVRDSLPRLVYALSLLHQKAEVELIDWPRNYRRRELRKHGKEPSPYFRIIAPGKPEKRYPSNGNKSDNKIKLPLHTVRGHFRHVENHPIEHFNGTFWIPAHTRGDEKMGKLQKHYKIRLPEDSKQSA